MSRRSTSLVKATLAALHYTGIDRALAPATRGAGAIVMLHQVGPERPEDFSPNRILKITPEFLASTLTLFQEWGFDCVSLDEAAERLKRYRRGDRPFAAFTLDDAYRDNFEHAAPVFRRFGVPYTVYAPTDYIDGTGALWWLELELAIAASHETRCTIDGVSLVFDTTTAERKYAAYHDLYWRLRAIEETNARALVAAMCRDASIDTSDLCRKMILGWDDLRALASDPLATIGGHTKRHFALAKLGAQDVAEEIASNIGRLERELQRPVKHFSYPFGDPCSAGEREFAIAKEMGLTTAVTTRKGLLFPRHANTMTALPRFSLNGDYQHPIYTKTLLSGAPFALYDLAKRVVG